MTINQTIAQHGTEICIGAFGLASLGTAAIAVPAAVLATLGAERIAQCDRAVLARSRKAIEVLQTLGALDAGEAQRTRDLLRGAHLKLRFTAAELLDLRESATLPDDLVARIVPADALNGDTAAVRRALRDVLTTAFAKLFTAGKHRDALMFEAQIRILDSQKHLIEGFDAFRAEAMDRHAELTAGIETIRDDIAVVNTNVTATRAALDNLTQAPRDMMEALASRFEIERVFDYSDTQLRSLLEKKAEEYRSYRVEIEAIDERTKGLGNLKTAARDAAENLNFDEVELLLSRVHEVEVEIAAETAELRATNALLRGRVDQAFALFSAAADSFAAVDPLEPARRRLQYMQSLYFHGVRYGGPGLIRAISILRHDSMADLQTTDPLLWGKVQNNLASALKEQANRTQRPEGATLLAQAVKAYRDALTVYTRADHPLDWATTQNNFANALKEQGSRTQGPEGATLLAQAVMAYHDALTVHTRADHPVDWAGTQYNLARCHLYIAAHDSTDTPDTNLDKAEEHVAAAFTVFDDSLPFYHQANVELAQEIAAARTELQDKGGAASS